MLEKIKNFFINNDVPVVVPDYYRVHIVLSGSDSIQYPYVKDTFFDVTDGVLVAEFTVISNVAKEKPVPVTFVFAPGRWKQYYVEKLASI